MTELALIFFASFAGAWVGAAFGGSLIIVSPLLVASGYSPLTVIASTRVPLIAQSLIGIYKLGFQKEFFFRHLAYFCLGGLLAGLSFFALTLLGESQVIVYLILLFLVSLASFSIIKRVRDAKTSKYPVSQTIEAQSFFPAMVLASSLSGLTGTGAGLLYSFISIVVIGIEKFRAARIEKILTIFQSIGVISSAVLLGVSFDWKILFTVWVGNSIGSFFSYQTVFQLPIRLIQTLICLLILVSFFIVFNRP